MIFHTLLLVILKSFYLSFRFSANLLGFYFDVQIFDLTIILQKKVKNEMNNKKLTLRIN